MAGLRVGYAVVPEGGPDLAPGARRRRAGAGGRAVGGRAAAPTSARRRREQADAQRGAAGRGVRRRRRASAPTPGWRAGGRGAGRAADLRRARDRLGRRASTCASRCSTPPPTDRLLARAARDALDTSSHPCHLNAGPGWASRSRSTSPTPSAAAAATTRSCSPAAPICARGRRTRPTASRTRREHAADTRLIEVRELRDAIFALLLAAAAAASRRRSASSSG